MVRSKFFAALLVSASPFCVVLAPQALAQQAANVRSDDFADIVVTANKRQQRATDVGIAVAVLDSSVLETRNIVSAGDLQNIVPGLSVGSSGFSTPIYSLRGVGVNELSIASGSSVAVYVDEVPYTLPVMTQGATLDLERVEVVKGPQGTLYGQNATGGAINYIAAKPTDSLEAGVRATYGRYNAASAEGYISGPLGDGVSARLALRTDQQFDGWQKSVSRPGDTIGKVEKYSGRLILLAEPSDTLRLTFNANGWIDKSDNQVPQLVQWVGQSGNGGPTSLQQVMGAPSILPPLNRPDTRLAVIGKSPRSADWDANRDFSADNYFWQTSLRVEADISDEVTLTSISAYMRTRVRSSQEIDGMGTSLFPATLGQDVNNTAYFVDAKTRTFSQEARLAANFGIVNWTMGATYLNEKIDDVETLISDNYPTINNLPGGGFTRSRTAAATKVESYGVFTNVEFKFTDQFSVAGGLRISEEKRRFEACSRDAGDGRAAATFNTIFGLTGTANAIQPGGCYSRGTNANGVLVPMLYNATLRQNNTPWNFNVNYKPTPDTLLYGRISKGYKSGNFPTIFTNSNASFFPVSQESVVAYEAGFKANVRGLLTAEGAVFKYDYTDKQQRGRELTPAPFGLVAKQVNVPKSEIKGAELAVTLMPVTGLRLGVAGVYLDSKIKEYTGYNIDGIFGDQSGGPLPFVSKKNLNLDINYETPVSDTMGMFVGGNMAYRSKSSTQINASSRWDLAPYTTYDAQLGVTLNNDKWRIWLWGKNITNKLYWLNVIKSGETVTRFTGMGATYGITASLKWK